MRTFRSIFPPALHHYTVTKNNENILQDYTTTEGKGVPQHVFIHVHTLLMYITQYGTTVNIGNLCKQCNITTNSLRQTLLYLTNKSSTKDGNCMKVMLNTPMISLRQYTSLTKIPLNVEIGVVVVWW